MPIVKAMIAAIKTPAAEMSLIFFICSFSPGETKSDKFSMDVLIISATKTNPMERMTAIHSCFEILKAIPEIITRMVATK